jgi:hypothetical protein
MIKQLIECEWPGCSKTYVEEREGLGFCGWGHVRGFKLDGVQRDLHLCPEHLTVLGNYLKEAGNGVDRP